MLACCCILSVSFFLFIYRWKRHLNGSILYKHTITMDVMAAALHCYCYLLGVVVANRMYKSRKVSTKNMVMVELGTVRIRCGTKPM